MVEYGRDITISAINERLLLVTTCDSCGAIGQKELDVVKVPATLVGELTARVALMELISVGAIPKTISIAIAAEPEPTGKDILKGIQSELKSAGLADLPRIISTEKNIETRQTALGIGVSGICHRDELRVNRSRVGDYVYILGYPIVGEEVKGADDPQIPDLTDIMELNNNRDIHDILPVGSLGIQQELQQLMTLRGFQLKSLNHNLDLQKSAGPASCVIVTAPLKINHSNKKLGLNCIGRFY